MSKPITITAGQVWEPKRGRLWARVERCAAGRVFLEKYAPNGDYSDCGAIAGPYKINIAERSLRGDYRLALAEEALSARRGGP